MLYSTILSAFAALTFGVTSLAAPLEHTSSQLEAREATSYIPLATPLASADAAIGVVDVQIGR